ncbi:MAG: hypothetical protein ABI806_24725 [Candidatus Solibacter sp.]
MLIVISGMDRLGYREDGREKKNGEKGRHRKFRNRFVLHFDLLEVEPISHTGIEMFKTEIPGVRAANTAYAAPAKSDSRRLVPLGSSAEPLKYQGFRAEIIGDMLYSLREQDASPDLTSVETGLWAF